MTINLCRSVRSACPRNDSDREDSIVKEAPVPHLPLSNVRIPTPRRPVVDRAVQGLLVCCLVAMSSAAARAQSPDAGPVQPGDWKIPEWRNYRLAYTNSLRATRLTNEDKTNLRRGVEFYLYGMTQAEPPESILDLRRGLMTNLRSTITTDAARQYLLEEIVRISEELLDQPSKVRLNILILLASLPTNPTPDPPLPFVPANDVLLKVVNNPEQLVHCKIWAAIGLGRISRDANPNINIKNRIAVDLVRALDSPEAQTSPNSQDSAESWYRMRLIEALGDNGLPANVQQEPVVIDAMMRILHDSNEQWAIRSTAARSCTQLAWDAQTNVPLVNFEVCKLAHQMAEAYNQQLAQNNNQEAPYWRRCFLNVYLSYQPLTAEQKQRGWGLLQRAGAQYMAAVRGGYDVVLPVVNAVTRDVAAEKVPQAAIDDLGSWLQNNPPDSFKVTPGSEELKPPGSEVDPHASSFAPAAGEDPGAAGAGTIAGASGS